MEPTLQDYARHGVIVTTEEEVAGEPTVPLGFALDMADHLADYEPEA